MTGQRKWYEKLLGAFFLVVLAAGCSQPGKNRQQTDLTMTPQPLLPTTPASQTPNSTPTATVALPPAQETPLMPAYPGSQGTIDPSMDALVQAARADLAERLGVAEDEIEVLEARAVVWPDASLGCPQPGMVYIQIMIEGGLIRLEANGREYNYHLGGEQEPFLCEPSSR